MVAEDPARRGGLRRKGKTAQDDEWADAFDVPAAVVCAFCGQPDCLGCSAATELASGIVAIVPWERPGSGVWTRLWATARATTQGADSFFAALPDGPTPAAFRFALLAEGLAVTAMVMTLLPLAVLALPTLALEIAQNPEMRDDALRWAFVGIPALTVWMVIAHAAHGAALDAGARRQGAAPQRRRALRFGLYACGWDLMSGPLGAGMTLVSHGLRAAAKLFSLTVRVPGRASIALLRGVYGLEEAAAHRARRAGSLTAVALALLSGLVVMALLVAR